MPSICPRYLEGAKKQVGGWGLGGGRIRSQNGRKDPQIHGSGGTAGGLSWPHPDTLELSLGHTCQLCPLVSGSSGFGGARVQWGCIGGACLCTCVVPTHVSVHIHVSVCVQGGCRWENIYVPRGAHGALPCGPVPALPPRFSSPTGAAVERKGEAVLHRVSVANVVANVARCWAEQWDSAPSGTCWHPVAPQKVRHPPRSTRTPLIPLASCLVPNVMVVMAAGPVDAQGGVWVGAAPAWSPRGGLRGPRG